jgi:hypothetical protein
MFFKAPGKPTSLKKAVYLFSSTILGAFLAFLAHAAIEMNYLNWLASRGEAPVFYGGCALHPLLQIALWLAGIIGGWLLGRYWWRKVYVEHFWDKFFKK